MPTLYIQTYIQTYIHTCIHTYLHNTYLNIYIYTYASYKHTGDASLFLEQDRHPAMGDHAQQHDQPVDLLSLQPGGRDR